MKGNVKVYRYLSHNELMAYLSGDTSCIGSYYDKKRIGNVNTHLYRRNVRYLHFFKNKEDIVRAKALGRIDDTKKTYVCEFEIPFYLLIPAVGLGFYHGEAGDLDKVLEFKVPVKYVKPEYLKSYTLDTDPSKEPESEIAMTITVD